MEKGDRVRVTLKWVQILDKLEPFFKKRGEFRFRARFSTPDGRLLAETTVPKQGHIEVTDKPGWNRLQLDEVVFEGEADGGLVVEFAGEELDRLGANERLDHYRRVFAGEPASWLGWYGPGDEEGPGRAGDPENMSNWRVCYTIERA